MARTSQNAAPISRRRFSASIRSRKRADLEELVGGFRRRDERIQQQSQTQIKAQAAQQNQAASYHRAMAHALKGAAIV